MKVEVISQDHWHEVKNAAMNTIGKDGGIYPSTKWKKKILLAEHSPIRLLTLTIKMHDIPYWVSTHIVRHKIGIEHFVSSQRTDRTGVNRDELPQNALVSHTIFVNAQSLIYISRKRLCSQASKETRELWKTVVEAVKEKEPEIGSVLVPECVYRGFCPEMKGCGYVNTDDYKEKRREYMNMEV